MFHDTPVERIRVAGSSVIIETGEFAFSPTEVVKPGRIEIGGIGAVFRYDEPVGGFHVEQEDAEIYALDQTMEGVELALIWQAWTPKRISDFVVYRFPGATLRVEALDGGPLQPIVDPESDCMR